MRGYKAKALRKLALGLHPETAEDMGYFYPRGRKALRKVLLPGGGVQVMEVTGQMMLNSTAHRLYKRMKRDLRIGGQ